MIDCPPMVALAPPQAARVPWRRASAKDNFRGDPAGGKDTTPHILLIEPDDELCLWLWHATIASKARVTMTDSLGSAASALRTAPDICLVVVDAELPDGDGTAMSADMAGQGRPFLLIHRMASCLRVHDWDGHISDASEWQVSELVERAIDMARTAAMTPATRA